jgi:uncharacterized membrane protein (DUF4010 family)
MALTWLLATHHGVENRSVGLAAMIVMLVVFGLGCWFVWRSDRPE